MQNITYATAPDLVSAAPVALKLDVFQPAGDTVTNRPAVIWVHGGGFRTGAKAATTTVASEYAQRGYVTVSIDYRLDPGNRCQDVQDGKITDPDELAAETARCERAIFAAQHDTQAVARFVRSNASAYGVNPGKIAVGGFSAGAVTALHVAYRSDDPGDAPHDAVQNREKNNGAEAKPKAQRTRAGYSASCQTSQGSRHHGKQCHANPDD